MPKRDSYASFYALYKKMLGASKEELVLQWTCGRTSSLREMSELEYNTMIRELRQQVESLDEKRKARSAALKQLQLYGIDTTNWDAVDRFCCNPRIIGKRFAHLNIRELTELRAKMLSIRHKAKRKQETEHQRELAKLQTKGQLPS
jgi:hypothetical protein bfra3_13660|nr:MAG TPA: Protein of unknown function (DUF1018) [Caudoviricetes sp.]